MRITFVNTRREMYPSLGVCYLSSYLKERIFKVEINLIELVLGQDMKKAIKRILDTVPDIIGFTSYTVGFSDTAFIAETFKKNNSSIAIWLGGPHITSLPQTLPVWADLGVIGEGEETFSQLCQIWLKEEKNFKKSLNTVDGICYWTEDHLLKINPNGKQIQPLDSIAPPDISLLDMDWYTKPKRFFIMKGNYRGFVLLTSRGCPYRCSFCQAAVQWGSCRYHSARRVVYELERIRKGYPKVNAINVIDDLFIGDRDRLEEIVRLIKGKNLHDGIVFNINGRANLIDEEILSMLKSINVIQVSYGFESNSRKILSFLKKKSVTVEQNIRAAELTNKYGIGVGGQFMFGTPGETRQDVLETIDFIENNRMSHAHLSVTMPLPGTELWDQCKNKGLVSELMDWRQFDFGNPDHPNLLCINEALPRNEYLALLNLIQKSCNKWNSRFTPIDYFFLIRTMTLFEIIIALKKKLQHLMKKIFCIFSGIFLNKGMDEHRTIGMHSF